MKGQTEIIGLLIIVIIVTIAMLFYVSYAVSDAEEQGDDNVRKEFVDNELAVSFVKSLADTHIEDCGVSFDDLVKDCGLYGDFGRLSCLGGSSCDYVEKVLTEVSESTLEVWGRSYDLRVDYGEQSSKEPMIRQTNDCDLGTIGRRAPGVIFVPYYPNPNQARIELAICKN